MRVFKAKHFQRFAKKEGISDKKLLEAVSRAERGSIDADLGGGLIKQRVSRPNAGRSGGYRTILMYREGEKAYFIRGFAKNEEDNISREEEKVLKKAAKITLALSDEKLKELLTSGAFVEVEIDD